MHSFAALSIVSSIVLILFYMVCFIVSYLIGNLDFNKLFGDNKSKFITFIGNFLKGFMSIIVITIMINSFFERLDNNGNMFHKNDEIFILVLAGYVALYGSSLGHLFPIYYKFKGFRDISVSLGGITFLSPLTGLVCLASFLTTISIKKNATLGTIIFAIILPIGIGIEAIGEVQQLAKILFSLPITISVIYMNRNYIKEFTNKTKNNYNHS